MLAPALRKKPGICNGREVIGKLPALHGYKSPRQPGRSLCESVARDHPIEQQPLHHMPAARGWLLRLAHKDLRMSQVLRLAGDGMEYLT